MDRRAKATQTGKKVHSPQQITIILHGQLAALLQDAQKMQKIRLQNFRKRAPSILSLCHATTRGRS